MYNTKNLQQSLLYHIQGLSSNDSQKSLKEIQKLVSTHMESEPVTISNNESTWPEERRNVAVVSSGIEFTCFMVYETKLWCLKDGFLKAVKVGDTWRYLHTKVETTTNKNIRKYTYDTDVHLLLKEVMDIVKVLRSNTGDITQSIINNDLLWCLDRYIQFIKDESYRGTEKTKHTVNQARLSDSKGLETWLVCSEHSVPSLRRSLEDTNVNVISLDSCRMDKGTLRPVCISDQAQVFLDPHVFTLLLQRAIPC